MQNYLIYAYFIYIYVYSIATYIASYVLATVAILQKYKQTRYK